MSVRYAGRLALAHVLACVATSAIVIPLGGITPLSASAYFTGTNIVAAVLSVVAGTVCVGMCGFVNIRPTLLWFISGRDPTARQRRAARRLVGRASAVLAATWALSGAVIALLNVHAGAAVAVPTLIGVVLGASAAVGTGILLTQDGLRPIMSAITQGSEGWITLPSVRGRLLLMWILCTALPAGTIAGIIFIRAHGWVIARTAPVEVPMLVVAFGTVLLTLPMMFLTSRSISDPLGEVVDAIASVEQGDLDVSVSVYDRSEIGRLQRGFNRMVAGLSERERLRDLFGRHVGADVAHRALQEGASLAGDVQDVAILFIDMVGSTQLAFTHPPQQVAELLNDFFKIVVEAVGEREGMINKFEGDAALAVFGAPVRIGGAASAALATARELADELSDLQVADYGIGVSAGPVFAGNVGAPNRYEYTVIGDPVNEAARLADLAKNSQRRILASAAAMERADQTERRLWSPQGSEVLRGRSGPTDIYAP